MDKIQMFENFPTGNSLYLSEIYFDFEREPIVFTCYDNNNQIYFCLRTQCTFPRSCMIVSVDKETLDRGLSDNIPILDLYKGREVIMAEQQEPYEQETYRVVRYEDIPRDDLPSDLEVRLFD